MSPELVAAILTRRWRKCLAQGTHTPGTCTRCGIHK